MEYQDKRNPTTLEKKPEQFIPNTITIKPILYRIMISKFIWIDWKSSLYSYGAFWVKFFSVSLEVTNDDDPSDVTVKTEVTGVTRPKYLHAWRH